PPAAADPEGTVEPDAGADGELPVEPAAGAGELGADGFGAGAEPPSLGGEAGAGLLIVYVSIRTGDWLPARSTAMILSVVVPAIEIDALNGVFAVVGSAPSMV